MIASALLIKTLTPIEPETLTAWLSCAFAWVEIQAGQRQRGLDYVRQVLTTAKGETRKELLWSFANLLLDGNDVAEAETSIVQMKQMAIKDPTAIEKRKQEIRTELKGALEGCVGKRITDGMLACVARAQTASDIDACMR